MPDERRTRATFRSAEFGFFGVVVYTRVHTPRRCGEPLRAGVLFLLILSVRPLRTSCWIVGTGWYLFPSGGFGIPWLRTPPSLRRDHRCPRCRLGVPCELRTGKPSRSNSSGRESPCQGTHKRPDEPDMP